MSFRSILIILSLLLFSNIFSVKLSAQEWGEIYNTERDMLPPEDYPNTGAVVIFDHGFATAERRGLEFKRHVRIKVFNSNNIDNIKNVRIEYYDYDNLFGQKALIHHPDGSVSELDKKKFDVLKIGQRRECHLSFDNVSDGDILEYTYKIDYYGGYDELGPEKYFLFSQEKRYNAYKAKDKRKTTSFDSFGMVEISNLPDWYFDHPVFCMESKYVAKIGADIDYTYYTVNIPNEFTIPRTERIKFLTATAYKEHTWRMKNLPPSKIDTTGDFSDEFIRPFMNFTLSSTVGTKEVHHAIFTDKHFMYVGRSFQGYINEYFKKTKDMRKRTKKIVSELDDPHAKIEAIYNFISDEYELVSTEYDLHPKHKNMKNLYKKKNGMPFELNLLLVQMLKIAGFKTWPVLISTRNTTSFRWTGEFNHIIVLVDVDVDGEALFLDASSKNCPPGFLLPKCLPVDGVLVDYGSSKPILVKAEVCESN